jgi:hypothetical protein
MPITADTTTAGDGSLAPEVETMVAAGETSSLKAGVVAGQDLATSSSDPTVSLPFPQPQAADASSLVGTDDIIREVLEAIFGHPPLRAPGDVSLDEAMGTAHWALNQARDVLRQESGDI